MPRRLRIRHAPDGLPHSRRTDRDVVIPLEVHGDLVRPEVIVLTQIHDLADDLGAGFVR